jgi:excisionase family DNA binding protein
MSFAPDELKRFKAELDAPVVRTVRGIVTDRMPAVVQPDQVAAFVAALSAERSNGKLTFTLDVKPILTLDEAHQFTGIPERRLKEAIKAGHLKAALGVWGRGYRMRRTDLDTFIAKMKLV